jgi:hypothetical protein
VLSLSPGERAEERASVNTNSTKNVEEPHFANVFDLESS